METATIKSVTLNCQEVESDTKEVISDGSFKYMDLNVFAPNFIESRKAVFMNGIPADLNELSDFRAEIEEVLRATSKTKTLAERIATVEEAISFRSLGATIKLKSLQGDCNSDVAVIDFEENSLNTALRQVNLYGYGDIVGDRSMPKPQYVTFPQNSQITVDFNIGLYVPIKVTFVEISISSPNTNKLLNADLYLATYKDNDGYLFVNSNVKWEGVMTKKEGVNQGNLTSVFVLKSELENFLVRNFDTQMELSLVGAEKKELYVDAFLELVETVFKNGY